MPRAAERKKPARNSRSAASPKPAGNSAVAGFALGELRQLIDLVQSTGIGELELAAGGRSVRISVTTSGTVVHESPAPMPAARAAATAPAGPSGSAPAPAADPDAHLQSITSPMVGTFYRAPAPDADPFIEIGDIVEVGQTVCIIEAMKLMNEIEAESKGRVVRVLIDNAQPVEFGQKLILLEPI
jgi:acetyl-CoA carboxylase biotin carboxyl carrier protein